MTRETALDEWLAGLPPVVQSVAKRLPPWGDYRLTSTGQRAAIQAYAENGTVRCLCWRDELGDGFAALTRVSVFGINPNDLVPA